MTNNNYEKSVSVESGVLATYNSIVEFIEWYNQIETNEN